LSINLWQMVYNKNMDRYNANETEISSGIIVYKKTIEGPRFLILYHGHRYWNFPKGKIEKGESSLQTALRETYEETGLNKKDLNISSSFKTEEKFVFLRRGKKIYKTVVFYLSETNKRHILLSKEHWGFGWFTYRETLQLFTQKNSKDTRKALRQAYSFLNNTNKK